MRSLQSKKKRFSFSMRQRIQPRGPARGSSYGMPRDTTMDIEGESAPTHGLSLGNNQLDHSHQPIPMYNPQSYPQSQSPLNPRSSPWQFADTADATITKRSSLIYASGPRRNAASDSQTFVPDSAYKDFLRSGPSGLQRSESKFAFRGVCCARFCALFSCVAVMFLVFVGVLFDVQPLYIPGSLPKDSQVVENGSGSKEQIFYSTSPSKRLIPASNAYQAALVYFITSCLCFAYSCNLHFWLRSRFRNYHVIPDSDQTYRETPASLNFGLTARKKQHLPTVEMNEAWQREYFQYDKGAGRFLEPVRSTYNRVRLFAASKWLSYKDHNRVRRREAGPKEV